MRLFKKPAASSAGSWKIGWENFLGGCQWFVQGRNSGTWLTPIHRDRHIDRLYC